MIKVSEIDLKENVFRVHKNKFVKNIKCNTDLGEKSFEIF